MLGAYTQRPRKPLANAHKNKDTLQLHISPYILSAHAKEQACQTGRPSTHRPKGKQNKKNRKSIRKDQFPEFAIKFRNQTYESNKISESFSSRAYGEKNLEESFGRPAQKMMSQQQPKQPRRHEYNAKEPRVQSLLPQKQPPSDAKNPDNKKYAPRFSQALEKIFKSLDVFNRGRISQTNINKWIPQSALYFLGGVFQKIKQQRLTLSYAQFEALCRPLLMESGEQDIKWFIEEVNGKEPQLNVSINMTSDEKGRQSSPVIMKINNNYVNHYIEKPKSRFQNSSSNRKPDINSHQPIQFEKVINSIKFKEKQLNIRLNSMKEKHQNNPPNPHDLTKEFSFFGNQKNQEESNKKKELSEFDKIKIQASAQKQRKAEVSKDYLMRGGRQPACQVPNFTFQLPRNTALQTKSQNMMPRQMEKESAGQDYSSLSVPKTSRIVRQSVPKEITNSCSKRPSMGEQDGDRLDKLSSRLEQYIKFNKEKLQQNKKFIKENSTPRK